ncbi:hypothetical protein JCGZ_22849 [Jatropha curcas]|uniref:Uncharacterized protein n=1 Tax=Jatropha curcas TaxID=180498 RepID=A0A067K2A6_JATCU|nr:hypothetical protein JCGZ_22849 [Jatropha curcas]
MTITPIDFAAITGYCLEDSQWSLMTRCGHCTVQACETGCHQAVQLGATALSYLYYSMDLCIRGEHLKVGCKPTIEGGVNVRILPRGRAWRYNRRYSHTNSDIGMFQQLLNGLSLDRIERHPWGDVADFPDFVQVPVVHQHKRLLLSSLFYDMNYLGERRVRRGFEPRDSDTAAVVGTPEHGPGSSLSFILDRTDRFAQGMLEIHLVSTYRMSPPGCTHVSIDDYNKRVDMAPPANRGRGMQSGGHAGRGAGCNLFIVEQTEESDSEDLEETASNIS